MYVHRYNEWPGGLPDGIFSNPKSQFGEILEGLELENVDTFYGHLKYNIANSYILWHFFKFCGNIVYFSHFWYIES
jgi:hypothetical protein